MTIFGVLLLVVLVFVESCLVCNIDKTYLAEPDKPEGDIEQRVKRNDWLKQHALNAAMRAQK